MKLYIIGNGFDINHGLPTKYSDFLEYVCLYHHDEFHKFGQMFANGNPSKLWSNFEDELGVFDVAGSIRRNIKIWDNIKKRHPSDYKFRIGKIIETFRGDLIHLFEMWVNDKITKTHATAKYRLDSSSYYLVFNYTNVLNATYGIDETRTCYIHGNCANNFLRKPEVGHGRSDKEISEHIKSEIGEIVPLVENTNFTVEDICDEYYELLRLLRKDTECLLKQESDFFRMVSQSNIESVYILGHSLSKPDSIYMETINSFIRPETPIFVSYHSKDEIRNLKERANEYFTNHPISFHLIGNILQPIQ